MAINSFIPTIWSARLLQNLETSLVYAQPGVVNRDYEGDISDVGDTVKINSLGPVTVAPYTKNANMAPPETLNDATQVLEITQADSFNFQIDDIDRRQQKPKLMDDAMRNAARALADTADKWLAALMAAGVPLANTQGAGGAGLSVGYGTGDTSPYIALLNASIALDEANVPSAGRWAVVPPWFHGYLLMDPRFVGSGAEAADARGVNGFIGRAAGFDIYKSNNVPFAEGPAEYKVLLGTDYATTFAEQINSVEAYRPELRFADAIKGLHLYGAKVVYPMALALIIADIGTAS